MKSLTQLKALASEAENFAEHWELITDHILLIEWAEKARKFINSAANYLHDDSPVPECFFGVNLECDARKLLSEIEP